jgi:hypothetical protein
LKSRCYEFKDIMESLESSEKIEKKWNESKY